VPTIIPERSVTHALILGCVVSMAALHLAVAADAPKEWDGLVQRPSKNVGLLYVRPDASLAGYKRIRLEPLQVAFDKNWDPNRVRAGANRLTESDFEKIKKALAEEFAKVCESELAKGGYVLVKEPGDEVLTVQPFVIDLYIAAPDKQSAGRSRTYTADPGHMTLVAELRDSETNQILARVVDKRSASTSGMYQLTTSVTNMGAARQIIARWASALRNALDVANGKS
jgi:Protein of unknown function (DUF3313)